MANTYSAGTVAVTYGSKTVTITGGLFISINVKPGDQIGIAGGLLNAIDTLTDATHLELVRAWEGATGAGLTYIVWHMPSGWGDRVELNEAVAENIRLLGEGIPFTAEQLEAANAAAADAEASMESAAQSEAYAEIAAGTATTKAGEASGFRDQAQAAAVAIQSANPSAVVGAATIPEAIAGERIDKAMNPANTKAVLEENYGNFRAVALPRESGWLWGVVDAASNLAMGVDLAGKMWFAAHADLRIPIANLAPDATARMLNGIMSAQFTKPESGWLMVLTDAADNIGWGIKPDGTFWAKLASDVVIPQVVVDAIVATAVAAVGGSVAGLFPTADIVGNGDSLTAGAGGAGTTWATVVAAALGRAVSNRGIGGQTSSSIAARQGGLPMLVTVAGNQIPGSGTVAVTSRSQQPITSQGTQSLTGKLGGTSVTLASTDLGVSYTLSLTTPGAAIACPPNSQIIFDLAVADRGKTAVFWAGRNDAKSTRAQQLVIRDNLLTMTGYLSPTSKRFLVLSVTNASPGTQYPSGEPSGSASHTAVVATNKELTVTFGDRFIDIRRYLIDFGLADAGLTATADDLADVAADMIPRQLFSADGLHFNAVGYTLIGKFIARAIKARGW